MNLTLSGLASEDEMDNEDKINAMMEGRKLLSNASYFAFTATPKNKTFLYLSLRERQRLRSFITVL